MPGRIEYYVHSDLSTSNKGGCLVSVSCQTDFGAKSNDFVEFCKKAAMWFYAFGCTKLQDLAIFHPVILDIKKKTEDAIGENISIVDVSIMQIASESIVLEREASVNDQGHTLSMTEALSPI